jgi:hypothetical protein
MGNVTGSLSNPFRLTVRTLGCRFPSPSRSDRTTQAGIDSDSESWARKTAGGTEVYKDRVSGARYEANVPCCAEILCCVVLLLDDSIRSWPSDCRRPNVLTGLWWSLETEQCPLLHVGDGVQWWFSVDNMGACRLSFDRKRASPWLWLFQSHHSQTPRLIALAPPHQQRPTSTTSQRQHETFSVHNEEKDTALSAGHLPSCSKRASRDSFLCPNLNLGQAATLAWPAGGFASTWNPTIINYIRASIACC